MLITKGFWPRRPHLDPIFEQIAWRSAPQVRERTKISGIPLDVLVRTFETEEPILSRSGVGEGVVYIISAWLSEEANEEFVFWPYFNYLIYYLTFKAAGLTPDSFADYPISPVPHEAERLAILLIVILMLSTTLLVFFLVRRYSLRHPEALRRIVVKPEEYRKAVKTVYLSWEEIGFHRPLAGFLVLLGMGLVLFIPMMIYQTVILPRFLLPSAQALGAWFWVIRFFDTFWILFDWGTATAFVKYFSEYRVKEPARGLKYVQLFVWWQAITGTFQLGMVALIAAYTVPQTAYAYLAYYFVAHAIIQFPGFLRVFQYTLRALQRTDYDQVLHLLATPPPGTVGILVMVIQPIAVLLMRGWGKKLPVFGEMMGGTFGMGLGLYLTEICFFLVAYLLYKRLGYGAGVIFMAHFDWGTVKSALKFGAPITAAGILGAFGWTIQMILVERYMLNYAEVMGNWNVAFGLILAFAAAGGLYQVVMPAISEAFSHRRIELTRYYVAQGFKYGGWFSAFVGSALLAVCDRFILGSLGEEWVRAAQIVGILIIWGALQYPAWFTDRLQEGVGKPYLMALMLVMEQSLRIILMFLLISRFQIWGMIIAYMVALPTKDIVAWLINWRWIVRFRIYWWQSAFAPFFAGVVNYMALRAIGNLIWKEELVTSMLLFFIGILPSLPFFCFFCGLFGGWDDSGLSELKKAVGMSGVVKPISYMIYWSTYFGTRLSPLHNRFPIRVEDAMMEAMSLTAEKVPLA
jgi:O-antigen/teichoic acid export membrane protein